jgi:hypothetical protein
MSKEVEDFLLTSYRLLVRYALDNFTPITFTSEPTSRSVIWRHDCDHSLLKACDLGLIDMEEGMISTFFINIHSDTYNALSESGRLIIQKLLQQNHEIGIHLDVAFYGGISNEAQLEEILCEEKAIFQEHLQISPNAFSFHQPTERDFQFQSETYAGLVNCYSYNFRNNWRYTSDSNGYWRHDSISEVLHSKDKKPVQVLTHGEWWTDLPLQPRERLVTSLFRATQHEIDRYDEIMLRHSRTNKSSLDPRLFEMKNHDPDLYLVLTLMMSLGYKSKTLAILQEAMQDNASIQCLDLLRWLVNDPYLQKSLP